MAEGVAAAADTRDAVSDGECDKDDDDDDDDDDDEGDLKDDKDSMKTADKEEQRQYNAYICSKIDETWVSGEFHRHYRYLLCSWKHS